MEAKGLLTKKCCDLEKYNFLSLMSQKGAINERLKVFKTFIRTVSKHS